MRLRRIRVRAPASSESVYVRAAAERIRRNPRDPDALFARAAFFATNGKFREAVDSLNLLTLVRPDYPGLWRFKARLFAEVGDDVLARLCSARGESSL